MLEAMFITNCFIIFKDIFYVALKIPESLTFHGVFDPYLRGMFIILQCLSSLFFSSSFF